MAISRNGLAFGACTVIGLVLLALAEPPARAEPAGPAKPAGPGSGPAAGSVVGWGLNDNSNVAPGERELIRFIPVPGLEGVSAISAGGAHNLALKADGTVRAWGWNGAGQVGDGTTANRPLAVPVPDLKGILAVSAGHMHSLALKSDGTVLGWGENIFADLGSGDKKAAITPAPVKGLSGATAIAIGANHGLAAYSAGDPFWTWYAAFSVVVGERMAAYQSARFQAGLIGNNLLPLRVRKNRLFAALNNKDAPPDEKHGQMLAERLGRLSDQIMAQRKLIDGFQHDADVAVRDIRRELQSMAEITGDAYPIIGDSLKFYQDIYDQIPLDFALAEGAEDMLRWPGGSWPPRCWAKPGGASGWRRALRNRWNTAIAAGWCGAAIGRPGRRPAA